MIFGHICDKNEFISQEVAQFDVDTAKYGADHSDQLRHNRGEQTKVVECGVDQQSAQASGGRVSFRVSFYCCFYLFYLMCVLVFRLFSMLCIRPIIIRLFY
jgi:hypothetical protein